MSTWQIVPDADNNFRWKEVPNLKDLRTKPYCHEQAQPKSRPPSHLPSMADLISEECQTLMENELEQFQDTPMFRTGSGKAVAPKPSSIAKARSVLGDGNEKDRTSYGCQTITENKSEQFQYTPMFRSGLGKAVAPKSSSITKARSVLGDGNEKDCSSFGGQMTMEIKSQHFQDTPMFRMGSGKAVAPKLSSIAKARSVLGDGNEEDCSSFGWQTIRENKSEQFQDAPMFRTGSGKAVAPKPSSIAKARSVLGDGHKQDCSSFGPPQAQGNGDGFANCLFQTASGKKVNVSSDGISKAKALLGIDGNPLNSTFQGFELSNEHKRLASDSFGLSDQQKGGRRSSGSLNAKSAFGMPFQSETNICRNAFGDDNNIRPEISSSILKPPQIKFHTAGGRSLSVSADALQRARSLLGEPEVGNLVEGENTNSRHSLFKERSHGIDSSKAYTEAERCLRPTASMSFIQPTSGLNTSENVSENNNVDVNVIEKFDYGGSTRWSKNEQFHQGISLHDKPSPFSSDVNQSPIMNKLKKATRGPLTDITNIGGRNNADGNHIASEKRRFGRRSHVSPFKRPRICTFISPLNQSLPLASDGPSEGTTQDPACRKRVSTQYPPKASRMYIREFMQLQPCTSMDMVQDLPDEVRWMIPCNAEKYMFTGETGAECIDVDAFCDKLAQSGASFQYISKKWVANHYKWIVWKLACYDRFSSAKYHGKLLSVDSVLEELKYRYEREVNHGHRSAIKKILEGDASPSSSLVLCISAIHSDGISEVDADPTAAASAVTSSVGRVELTDGWYSVGAHLDALLSKYLKVGKLFVGQKLRICGARLSGWTQPVAPLEVPSTVNFLLHVNGTYRASWDERLGFCMSLCPPLSFACVKSGGGHIPKTLVGVTRVYPVLYRERMGSGRYIVRTEKAEAEITRYYNQRRSNIAEGIVSDYQRGDHVSSNDYNSEEGAKILKMLENAAEPEMLMAELSSEQLASFSAYQTKLESIRQLDIEKAIEKALADKALDVRDVTPFMRVRLVGLKNKGERKGGCAKEGLLTIWNPTEKQQLELTEGQAYVMADLVPLHSNFSTLFLQAKGSTLKWKPLTSSEIKSFKPFFQPRKSVLLSKMGEVPLSSEFDTTALVLHVGHEYVSAQLKKQWLFVTDGSISERQTDEWMNSLLAISFSSPCTDGCDASPVSQNLVGSVVGFCNLMKRAKDQANDLWVADATENTTYHLNQDLYRCSHLRHASASVQKWANISEECIEKLKQKVVFITGDSHG